MVATKTSLRILDFVHDAIYMCSLVMNSHSCNFPVMSSDFMILFLNTNHNLFNVMITSAKLKGLSTNKVPLNFSFKFLLNLFASLVSYVASSFISSYDCYLV